MRIEAEITNIRTSKKGDTLTIFIAKERRNHVVKHIMPFIEKPITLELLINAEKVLEDMDRITEEQRKKVYQVLNEFAREYGDTTENVKALLKEQFEKVRLIQNFSLSDCQKDTASDFIEFVLSNARSMGYAFAFKEQKNEFGALYEAKKCFVCQLDGQQFKNNDGKVCLCQKHIDEITSIGTKEFISKYHLELV